MRTELLKEWGTSRTVQAQLERTRTELERLQKAREESASSPRDQRYMPTTMSEAILIATQDKEEADALARSRPPPRARRTPLRAVAKKRHIGS